MISVIMSNYNGQKYLKEAIRSVLKQDFKDYEFIIIDDGSTDESKKIISNFQERNNKTIFPIYKTTNEGQAEGFNTGLKISKGEIICLIDSDDIWFSNKLRDVFNFFLNHKNISFHQHNLFLIEKGKLTDKKIRDDLFNGNLLNHIKLKRNFRELPQFIPTSGLSFSRSAIEKVTPIPKEFRTCADGYLTRTCLCYGDVASSNECWGVYRLHDSNNVYGNDLFDTHSYVSKLLVPNLNKFYTQNNIKLKFEVQKNFYRTYFPFLSIIRRSILYFYKYLFRDLLGDKK